MMPSLKPLHRNRLLSAALYVAAIGVLLIICWSAFDTLYDRYVGARAAEASLTQVMAHSQPFTRQNSSDLSNAPEGSPFLEGESVTVAGAALLQRVTKAINAVGGNVVSSQVRIEGEQAKEGWLGISISCDLEERNLQPLLYDLEANMPFLFIDQLAAQGPVAGVEQERMRLLFDVKGKWRGAEP